MDSGKVTWYQHFRNFSNGKHSVIISSRDSTPMSYSSKIKIYVYKNLSMNVHGSIINNCPQNGDNPTSHQMKIG